MIAYCPSCYRPSRVPAADHDLLQCPHCAEEFQSHLQEEYPLSHFLIDSGASQQAEVLHHGFDEEVPSNQSDSDVEIYIETEDSADDREFELQPIEATFGGSESSSTDDMQLDAVVRPRRKKQSSPIGSFIGVVFGGLAALPIATAIMWYAIGTDPFKIAPKVAEYAPWIVPERLAGTSFAQRNSRSSPEQAALPDLKREPEESENSHFTDEQLPQANDESTTTSLKPETVSPTEASSEKPNEAAALPFTADEQPPAIDGKSMLAFKSLERSFDAMLAAKDASSVTGFLDSWQRYVEVLPAGSEVAANPDMIKLQERLGELSDRSLQSELVVKSRARIVQMRANEPFGYVDAFEVLRVEPQGNSQSSLLVPTDRVKDPIKSMTVIAHPQLFLSNVEGGSSPRYLLLGTAKKDNADGKTTFEVLLSRPL